MWCYLRSRGKRLEVHGPDGVFRSGFCSGADLGEPDLQTPFLCEGDSEIGPGISFYWETLMVYLVVHVLVMLAR